MKSGKRHLTGGMELPNQDKIRTLAENETNKYLGIFKADTIKQVEMKNKIQKEYLRRTWKLLEKNLSMTMHYIPETTLTDYIYQEKREEEYLPALKTALTYRYNDLKTI